MSGAPGRLKSRGGVLGGPGSHLLAGTQPQRPVPSVRAVGPQSSVVPPTLPCTFPSLASVTTSARWHPYLLPTGASLQDSSPAHPTVLDTPNFSQNHGQKLGRLSSSNQPQPCWGCCPACVPPSPLQFFLQPRSPLCHSAALQDATEIQPVRPQAESQADQVTSLLSNFQCTSPHASTGKIKFPGLVWFEGQELKLSCVQHTWSL